jgi:iron complex transport system permease protein
MSADGRATPRRTGQVRRPPGGLLFVGMLALLALVIVLSFGVGPLRIPPGDVMHVIAHQVGLADAGTLTQRDISVVWNLRVPRALLAVIVGASLAMAGAGLQGLFGNPLADPGIVGVTHGAALGAVAAIVLGATVFGAWTIPVAAFAGGAVTTTLIYLLARPDRGGGTATLLLVGIAIAAGCSAAIGFFTYIARSDELQSLVFWQMGSLAMADWADLLAAVPAFAVGAIALTRLATPLDMLALGERQAQHIGLDVRRTRALLVAVCALLVGSAVAFAGVVGFVGLVVPHFVRLLAGPGHRWLLPLSGATGGLLVVLADTAARSLDPPSEIPLGLFSAALGAPFFLWLVLRGRKRGGA